MADVIASQGWGEPESERVGLRFQRSNAVREHEHGCAYHAALAVARSEADPSGRVVIHDVAGGIADDVRGCDYACPVRRALPPA